MLLHINAHVVYCLYVIPTFNISQFMYMQYLWNHPRAELSDNDDLRGATI